jgi:hypothetical protein
MVIKLYAMTATSAQSVAEHQIFYFSVRSPRNSENAPPAEQSELRSD